MLFITKTLLALTTLLSLSLCRVSAAPTPTPPSAHAHAQAVARSNDIEVINAVDSLPGTLSVVRDDSELEGGIIKRLHGLFEGIEDGLEVFEDEVKTPNRGLKRDDDPCGAGKHLVVSFTTGYCEDD